jgi:hypothetical protein
MHVRLSRRLLAVAGAAALFAGTALTAAAPAAQAAGPVLPTQDPFYNYTGSTPLSQIAPGTVLKKRSVSLKFPSLNFKISSVQVLFRTTGELGQPTVTVTTIIRPVSLVSPKIVAYQTAYDALGSECDPSYTLRGGNPGDTTAADEEIVMAAYLKAGYAVTVPDYEGENLEWGAGQESGYGTLDALLATESYLKVSPSTEVGMVGYSGGAIATEWASELAPSYAPQLHIIGAAAGGVPVDFAHNLTYINGDDDWSGIMPAILDSLGGAFDVHNINRYLSVYGKLLIRAVESECIASFAAAYPGLTVKQLLKSRFANPFQIPVLVRILNHLIMGSSGGIPAEPLLFGVGDADGTGDGIMIDGDVEALAHQYCQSGVPVTFDVYQGLPHAEAAVPFEFDALAFLEGQFNGLAAPNGCSSIGPGNSIAPLPIPGS